MMTTNIMMILILVMTGIKIVMRSIINKDDVITSSSLLIFSWTTSIRVIQLVYKSNYLQITCRLLTDTN